MYTTNNFCFHSTPECEYVFYSVYIYKAAFLFVRMKRRAYLFDASSVKRSKSQNIYVFCIMYTFRFTLYENRTHGIVQTRNMYKKCLQFLFNILYSGYILYIKMFTEYSAKRKTNFTKEYILRCSFLY